MMNIVLPMAGRGSRFADAGYEAPKPLIPVYGKPMIQLVIDNLRPTCPHRFIFLVLEDHLRPVSNGGGENNGRKTFNDFDLEEKLCSWAPGCIVVPVNQVTEGAACTVLLAKPHINNDDPLMIANCDQWIGVAIDDYLNAFDQKFDGFIMTMKAHDAKWSFVRLSDKKEVTEVVEKKVVSDEATVGIYNFRRGSLFVKAAEAMIAANLRVNNEFYVAPTYNQMIENKSAVGYYNIGSEWQGMYGLGTPQDLEKFLSLKIGAK